MDDGRMYMLGGNIRRAREDRGVSQRQLALRVGTSHSQMGRIEHGKTSVGFTLLCRIADALGMTVSELVSGM